MGSDRRPAVAATVVNAALVLFLPFVLRAANAPEPSVIVRPPGWMGTAAITRGFLAMAWPMLPLALLAGWRTWVHATRWMEGRRTWRGIGEAGLCGFAIAAFAVSRGFVRQPAEALGYLAAYGPVGFAAGLAVGVMLQLIAMTILAVFQRPRP